MSNEVKPTKLDRFGIKWQGARKPICTPADDGYWTPWHVAQERISELESVLREALGANQFNSHGWVRRAEELLEQIDG